MSSTSSRPQRGQFPYAYIRSKLAVLPEEGQLSRRESMNKADSYKDANGYLQPRSRSQQVKQISLVHSMPIFTKYCMFF